MNDDEFFTRLCDCSLAPAQFNHLGHLRLGWICLRRFELDEAIRVACGAIGAYAASLGAADKFHWTMTEALMRLLWADRALAWPAFVAANADLAADARAILARHYSAPLLASDRARAGFVGPDLAPLPA